MLRIAQPSFQTTHNPLKLSKSRRNSSRSKRTTRTSLKWVRAKRPNLNDAAVHEIVQYILWVTILLSPYMGDGATRFARIVEAAPLYPSSSRLSLRTRGKAGTPCSSKSAIMLSVLRRSPPSRGRRFEFSRMAECGDWVFLVGFRLLTARAAFACHQQDPENDDRRAAHLQGADHLAENQEGGADTDQGLYVDQHRGPQRA